ncbi:methyltransferase domain-containing protein [Candidatus Phycosocius spiralis]|uniref:Glycosyltransferase n=1 Tax=Candidatus Phycosocius spiralis TaxID=2815099 RepID=A0ABQ4PUS9_9PROT|nr:methyltransferase domain-containing protein [Candidatus Phycosocius spiralis]GIU66639.1 hypothetical protein PsB1_0793 [Candidatus Phycosocius spiralis]
MQFTNERYIPTEQGQIRLEHYHRYAAVLDVVKEKSILDIACGGGYGSFLMADFARLVIGMDMSDDAVHHAASNYHKPNLKFVQGSATHLAFLDNSFDVIVSFETIEHLAEQQEMLSEMRRVLRPDGILIISLPNRPIYSEESGEHNLLQVKESEESGEHNLLQVKELDLQEFDDLLRTQFSKIEYFGQKLQKSSLIQDLDGAHIPPSIWSDDGSHLKAHAGSLKDPVYFMAICTSARVNLPKLGMSVLYPVSIDFINHYVGFANWAKSIYHLNAGRDHQVVDFNQTMIERDEEVASLTEEKIRLHLELNEARAQVLALTTSSSWRITKPLREASQWISSQKAQTKRYAKASLRFAKRIYQALPFSLQTKIKHRNWIIKLSPRILLATGTHASTIPELNVPKLRENKPSDQPVSNFIEWKTIPCSIISIPTKDDPLVSVIIPIYGKIDYTLCCLASIAAHPSSAAFEVIIVDDCSPDNSREILSKMVKGIRLMHNKRNLGFIRSCNIGANAAKGKYLHFLNNDTEVTLGWMDELLRTFHNFPGTGLAGSKLIYPDGRLQEAGGIIWQDASAWNFGRFQDPMLPVYNYAREVDYCSGASIMVPKSLFDELGGFDEHYLPAYCEDSDLALKIRDKGHRVIYQPMSSVIHYEGITSGTDASQGVKAYQVVNSLKLKERWQHHLVTHQVHGTEVDQAKDRRALYRVLVLDHCTPTPDQDAGSVTAFNFLLLLREMGFQVTFIAESNFLYMPIYTQLLQRNGIEVLYAPYICTVKQHIEEQGQRYDLAFLFRPSVVEQHAHTIRKYCPNAKILYCTVDLHFLRMSREAKILNNKAMRKAAQNMRRCELNAIQTADASIIHSTAELEILRPLLPEAKLYLFPLILATKAKTSDFSARADIVFVGGYQHTPNVDAVQYFVADIMPILRTLLPGVCFYAVGSNVPPEIEALATNDVIITGFVEDLYTLLDTKRVSIAPLRYGAGIKGKIGTSLAVGLPVVATSLAAEGMLLTDGENIVIADEAEAFAHAVAKLYQDENAWYHLRQNGLTFAENTWGAEAAWSILANILRELGFNPVRENRKLVLYSTRFDQTPF